MEKTDTIMFEEKKAKTKRTSKNYRKGKKSQYNNE